MFSYNEYLKYNTDNPYEDSYLYEGRGIPTFLKNEIDNIFNIIKNDLSKQSYFFNLDYENIKLKNLNIFLIKENRTDVYGSSTFGELESYFLVNAKIIIRYNSFNEKEIKRVLLHELIHIYEIYKRIINKTDKKLQWQSINYLQKIRNKYSEDIFLSNFILMLYISSDHELNAIVGQLYSILIELRTTDNELLNKELKTTKTYKRFLDLQNFNFKNFNINYDKCIEFFKEYHTYLKTISDKNFKLFKTPNNKEDIIILLDRYQKLFNKKSIYLENKISKLINEVINDVNILNESYFQNGVLIKNGKISKH